MEKKPVSHFVVGILIALVLIITFLAFYFTGNAFKKGPLSWLPTVIFIAGIIYSVIQYAKAKDGNVTFGSCFGYGFKATAIVAIIMVIFLIVFLMIFPDYKQQFLDFMGTEMEKGNSNLTDDQKETSLAVIGKFFTLTVVGGSLFMNLLFGAIASLIGAAIAKKNPRDPFQQTV